MAGPGALGRYSHAVVRALPEAPGAEGPGGRLDLAKAQRQLGVFAGILRQQLGLQVVALPPAAPCAVLLEDVAVVQGDTALLTRPWQPARRHELGSVRAALEELKLRVVAVTDEGATLDGSDVLFTGREFFVGISRWTNHRGAEMVADAFRDFAVSTVPVGGEGHLKSFCSMAAPDTIAIGSSEAARRAMKAMEQLSDHGYGRLSVPDDPAGNCLFARLGLGGCALVHRSPEEFPRSLQPFQKLPGCTLLPASCSEVAKLGGALSSCALLVNTRPDA
ncbi:putative hydrolase DDAH2 [Struthio camelus]|uniref:putative hydrolase DDAH2 n=1 Tax=Struthio camelus TaxID=8801 RepID=UPI0036042AA9